MIGPDRYWYRQQLIRSTRNKWKTVLECFLVEYCGPSTERNRNASEYSVHGWISSCKKDHVDHFIDAFHDRDLADQLLLLGFEDLKAIESILRGYQRGRSRNRKASMGSTKYRQKGTLFPTPNASKTARAVNAIHMEDRSSGPESDLSGLKQEGDPRSMFPAATPDRKDSMTQNHAHSRSTDPPDRHDRPDRSPINAPLKPCTHCGSTKHNDLGCWKWLTCQKCGLKGLPAENCFFRMQSVWRVT